MSPSSKQQNSFENTKDYFIVKEGIEYAGCHLLVDIWGASKLNDLHYIDLILRECINQCNATLLHIHLHHFNSSGGISGVAVLAESHISVHTWPERGYAAFDIFMCGEAKPQNAISVLKNAFTPEHYEVKEILRGKAR